MGRIEEINALGDKILNEWGINNAKNLGLQVCTMAIEVFIENDRLRAERDAAEKEHKHYRRLYEQLESELRKVTFCRDCAIRNYDDPECPGCGNWGIPTKDDDGCTWGRPREERDNEL